MTELIPKRGANIRVNETPADLKLDNSYRSARLPITMTEANKTAIGRAKGKRDTDL